MKTEKRTVSFIYAIVLSAVAIFAPGCYKAQQENVTPQKQNEPKVQINVNREVDENGNVIRYDSTYTWSWSSDTSAPNVQFFFDQRSGNDLFTDSFFRGMPGFSDSLLISPFGGDFEQHFRDMDKMMEEQMKMFEEMQKQFFGDPREIIPQEEKKEESQIKEKKISM